MRAAAALAVLLVLATGCSTGTPRNSAGQITVAATTDAFSIKVGDCVGKLDGDSAERLPLTPCDQAHFWEAYASSTLDGTDFPGTSQVNELSDKACSAAYEDFIGKAPDDSKYEVTYLNPTKESWTQAKDREVVCLVGSSSGNITGSLKGTAK
ncbi:MAG TPA: septum formation family protein [Propionicimonas sp.]|uniref:septum formation family protein n=1 Tax=Propionicimonas sp. TaxID=1955623 RepID=UPI002F4190B8